MTPEPALAGLPARPYRRELGRGVEPAVVLSRLAQDREAMQWSACLSGHWFGDGWLIAADPLLIRSARPDQDALELAPWFEVQPTLEVDPSELPADLVGGGWWAGLGYSRGSSVLAFFDSLVRYRPETGWCFESLGLAGRADADSRQLARWQRLISDDRELLLPAPVSVSPVTMINSDARSAHLAAVEQAIGQIHRGDFYQVNICTRLKASFDGDSLALFAQAAPKLQPSYGGYLGNTKQALLSFSPELFLRVHGDQVTTAPIKGTATRRPGESRSVVLELSAKDQAENIMIVDLMRNDLAQVCRPGTVAVDSLLKIEPHPGVWHLTSQVSGRLTSGSSLTDLLQAAFPPGSVTGAPKSSAMGAIAKLEDSERGSYTGAIGLVSPCAGAEFNVAIRTFEATESILELGVGGGITADSVPIAEWRECLHKAAPLAAALNTTLGPRLVRTGPEPDPMLVRGGLLESMLADNGTVLRLAHHLARLDRSCRELYGQSIPADLAERIKTAVGPDRQAVRIRALPGEQQLQLDISCQPWATRRRPTLLVPSKRPAGLWRHKWADRSFFLAAEQEAQRRIPASAEPGETRSVAPVFVDSDGWVSETSRGNLFILQSDGTWATSPAQDDLLPGITRRAVLDLADEFGLKIMITPLMLTDLIAAEAIVWTSSLSGVVPVAELWEGTVMRHYGIPEDLLGELNESLGFRP